jgi:uncharacterized protein YdhG (YjbR/CyaY superfamily)
MAKSEQSASFSAEERKAMRERAKELKAQKGEQGVLEKIAEMPASERTIAEGVHKIVKQIGPNLEVKTWYGMPAYFKDGKVVVFFQSASKFQSRFCTLGFQDAANLDDGAMWATSFALIKLNPSTKQQIRELVEKAIS